MLDTQYRMVPDISAFPNRQFYKNRIQDHVSVQNLARARASRTWQHQPLFAGLSVLAMNVGTERQDDNHSYYNEAEVSQCQCVYVYVYVYVCVCVC